MKNIYKVVIYLIGYIIGFSGTGFFFKTFMTYFSEKNYFLAGGYIYLIVLVICCSLALMSLSHEL